MENRQTRVKSKTGNQVLKVMKMIAELFVHSKVQEWREKPQT